MDHFSTPSSEVSDVSVTPSGDGGAGNGSDRVIALFRSAYQKLLLGYRNLSFRYRLMVGVVSLVAVLAFALVLLLLGDGVQPAREYASAYRFVEEKISLSAPIVLNLPTGVEVSSAEEEITFDPPLAGAWLTTETPNQFAFQPSGDLVIGNRYAVTLATGNATITSDFMVDEDPKIEAIFPAAEDAGVSEYSSITVVFNRPMVPLTTLSKLDTKDIPIILSPATEGRWKWSSTRNVQFIPKDRLTRSADYTVSVGSMRSADGVSLKGVTHSFSTRPLRSVGYPGQSVQFDQPIVISYNQPIDLVRTQKEMSVVRESDKKTISFIAEYGTRTVVNEDGKKEVVIDRSLVHVYGATDRLGRARLWDFDSSYTVFIPVAYPAEGDIVLREPLVLQAYVPSVIDRIDALSNRSQSVRPDMFDPQGTLSVTFAEAIDLKRSDISAKGLRSVVYGETCKKNDEGEYTYSGNTCEKIEDTSKLIFSFDPTVFVEGESFEINLKALYNIRGVQLNKEPLSVPLRVYPALKVYSTSPVSGSVSARVDELFICSNTPLAQRTREDYKQFMTADNYLVFGSWPQSWWRTQRSVQENAKNACEVGQFETRIRYGLLPETAYVVHLSIVDEFGARAEKRLSFTTNEAKEINRRLQNLQKTYNVTPPGRTKLTFVEENIDFLNLHICKVTPETMLRYLAQRPDESVSPYDLSCEQSKEDSIQLPKRYFVNNFFTVDVAKYFPGEFGHYVVTLSNPDYRGYYSKSIVYEKTLLSVTRLAVGQKQVKWEDAGYVSYNAKQNTAERNDALGTLSNPGDNLWWVTMVGTMMPVSGATILPYTSEGNEWDRAPLVSAKVSYSTDEQGVARGGALKNIRGAVIRSGSDSALVYNSSDNLQWSSSVENSGKTYLYTDRPIYRPGHEVFIRGIDRIGFDGSYRVVREGGAKLTVYNSRGEAVLDQTVPVSSYGTFSTSFKIPEGAPLGTYRIEAFGNQGYFDVEEYVPSAFKLDVATEKTEYSAGDTVALSVSADYYFGVPVTGGSITYSVSAQDFHFDRYTDEYFNFGQGWYYCYSCGFGDRFLFRGKEKVNGNGKAQLSIPLDFTKYFKDESADSSKLFVVNVTVTDSAGRSVSSQKSFIVHRGDYYLGVKTDRYFAGKNERFTVRAKTVDTVGTPVGKGALSLIVNKVSWEVTKRKEVDGGFYYKSEKQLTAVLQESFSTDRHGDWSLPLSLAKEGEYEITVTGTDGKGNHIQTTSHMYVYGEEEVSIQPTNNYSLDLQTEKLSVKPGEQAHIIIKSPYKKAKALITVERGSIYEYRVVTVDRNLYDFTVPIKDEYVPNVFVSVLLLSDAPEIKFGQLQFTVDGAKKALTVDVSANKQNYLPGEHVTLTVKTSNYAGKPVPAEVSIAVADLSVLALKGNQKKNPFIFFYDGFPLTVTTASNMKNILYEVDIPLGTKGGGGASPDDLAKKKRGEFRDTAYWKSDVTTDSNGRATVSFTLPDNVTTWQIESIGVTTDTLIGADYGEIIAKKDLMVVPLKPRFVVPGDEFYLGAKIFNQSDRRERYRVSIDSTTLALTDGGAREVSIGAGESETVYFSAVAPSAIESGEHSFTFSAKNSKYEDVVEQRIAITRNDTYEAFATAHYTKGDSASEYVFIPPGVRMDKGGVTIGANATLAVFLADALRYLVSYPYGCGEQLASKLQTIAVAKRALLIKNISATTSLPRVEFEGVSYSADEAVTKGLLAIYKNQTPAGGFSYYPGLEPSFYLTLRMVEVLHALRNAGFAVREQSVESAVSYLYREYDRSAYLRKDHDTLVFLASVVLPVPSAHTDRSVILTGIATLANDTAYLGEKANSMALARLSMLAPYLSKAQSDRVYTALSNRLTVDGRGAYMKAGPSGMMYSFYETPVLDTALFVKATVLRKQEHVLLDKVLRWLMTSRSKDGSWGSTTNTIAVIDAMTAYLTLHPETESNYLLTLSLDGSPRASFDINNKTVLDTFTHFVPIGDLSIGVPHTISFSRNNRTSVRNNFYYDMSFKYFLPINSIAPRDEGITITRGLYSLSDKRSTAPLSAVKVGDVVRGKLTVTLPKQYQFISVEDFIPAGFELVNFNLSTEDQSLQERNEKQRKQCGEWGCEGYGFVTEPDTKPVHVDTAPVSAPGFFARTLQSVRRVFGGTAQVVDSLRDSEEITAEHRTFFPDIRELRDDRLFLFKEIMSPGVYEYEYYVRALVPGTFQHLPAVASEMYYPEIFGRTEGGSITVTAK